jgi:PPP family 3-phenylpropionic acid transporter
MATLLSTFYFFYFSIIGIYIIFMPKVLDMLGYSASEIGFIFGAGPLVRFLLPFIFMRGLKLNARTFNIAIVIMLVSSFFFYANIESFYGLLFSNIGLGIGLSLILPYIELISLKEIGKERYGKIRLFGSVGFVLVALVLVKFLTSAAIALNFFLSVIFLTALISFVIVKRVEEFEQEKKDLKSSRISLIKDWQLWAGLTLMQVSFGAFYNFFTIYETNHGISLDMTIYLWSFGVIVEIFMLYFQGRFLRGNLLLILQITTLFSALRWFLVFLFADNLAVMFFAQSIHALSFALFHSAAISYLYHLYIQKALAQQFFSGITYGLGGFVGAITAGYIYEIYPNYLFLSSSLSAFLAFIFIYLWNQKSKTKEVV